MLDRMCLRRLTGRLLTDYGVTLGGFVGRCVVGLTWTIVLDVAPVNLRLCMAVLLVRVQWVGMLTEVATHYGRVVGTRLVILLVGRLGCIKAVRRLVLVLLGARCCLGR